ncbi:MAG: YtxH domain-containing protein [Candidatus Margulisiibacteriota bacterium]
MGRIFKTLTFGSIIGFIAGLLFAPQKGEDTRTKLKESIDKGKGKFEEIKEEFTRKEE